MNIFFKYCIKERTLIFNPIDNVNKPKIKKNFDKKKYISKKEVSLLKEAFKKDDSLFIFIFALFTGLRQGEILALNHGDINFDEKLINVDKSLNRVGKMTPEG